MGIHLATHKDFFEYFPKKSVDILQSKIDIPENIKTENQFFDYFDDKNKIFYSENKNKIKYLKDSIKKINFILFNIYRDGTREKNGKYDNSKTQVPFFFNSEHISLQKEFGSSTS